MLASPKPLASLSSGLLARKGEARPAMRRQATLAEAGDDLGWNDMGEPAPLPPVLARREQLVEAIESPVEAAPAETDPAPTPLGRRAAFTLRLDADRHLRLRLASATRRVSAQKLVTEALDAFLETRPVAGTLAAGVTATNTDRLGD